MKCHIQSCYDNIIMIIIIIIMIIIIITIMMIIIMIKMIIIMIIITILMSFRACWWVYLLALPSKQPSLLGAERRIKARPL